MPISGSTKSTDQTGGKASLPCLTYAPDSTPSRAAAVGLFLGLVLRRPAFSLLSSSSSSSASKRYREREEGANLERGARESR